MMLAFVLVYTFIHLYPFIESLKCPGIGGLNCCYGFVLNDITGECEACSKGYRGKDCAIKCEFPTYGEGCQSECNCLENECHFSRGCILHTKTDTDFQKPNSGKATSTSLISNVTVSNLLNTHTISTEITKLSDATLMTIIKEDIFFKNNFVISLLAIFVLFFCIFVLTYVYFKCCRKRTTDYKITESEWKARYQSLSPWLTEPVNTVPPAQMRMNDTECLSHAYLTPVSNRFENVTNSNLQADSGVVETTTSGQIHAIDQMHTINEQNISLEDQSETIYNEIFTR